MKQITLSEGEFKKQKIKCFEVIGNIHDNPELLREEE